MKPSYRRLDFAYGCFACIALAMCFGPLLWILPVRQGGKEEIAMLLVVPIMFGAFLAGIAGLVFSIVYWREWPLGIMAGASIAFLLTWGRKEKTMLIAAVFYVVVLVSFCGWWFFFRRRKMRQVEGP